MNIVAYDELILGFSRLAIIDLSKDADQPMTANGKDIWIVFNGEIYGYKRLRKELIVQGHYFKTNSDTEVILNSYIKWGDDFVDHIDGMFAIAIYDRPKRKLKLFRDRVGIKPLYYFYDGKNFAFSSELKGITSLCTDVNFKHDHTAIYDYLTYHYIPEPKTLYKNVFKLPPASKLLFDLDKKEIVSIKEYWKLYPKPSEKSIRIEDACEHLRELIRESVKDQMVSDVPLGCFLSGGLDSSCVVSEAASLKNNIKTFTIGFSGWKNNEVGFADMVSRKFNTSHQVKELSNAESNQLFSNLKKWYDEPFADTSAFPTYLVAKSARKNITVALTGDGGDEIFGGYKRFKIFSAFSKFPHFPSIQLKRFFSSLRSRTTYRSFPHTVACGMESLVSSVFESYSVMMSDMPYLDKNAYARRWKIPEDYDSLWYFKKYYKKELTPLTRIQYLDFKTYLPSEVLTKLDRATMAVSLEARVPLLSRKVIEFMFSVPENIRYHERRLKGLIREAYKSVLPDSIINRNKRGFGVPNNYFKEGYDKVHGRILEEVFNIN